MTQYVKPTFCQRRCSIAIAGTNIAETNTYAVLFTGTDSTNVTRFGHRLPSEIFTLAQNGGGDICFTSDAAGQNQLPCEIVSFNTATSTAEIWVAVPLTAATTATIYAWYQSTVGSLSQPVPADTYGSQSVWNGSKGIGNMAAVYHFGTPTALSGADSTSNGHTLTLNGTPTAAAGWIGGQLGVLTTNSATNATAGVPQGTAAYTLQTWFSLPTNTANVAIGGWGSNTAGERRNHFYDGTKLYVEDDGASTGFAWTYNSNWHCLVSSCPASTSNLSGYSMYLDGVLQTTSGSGTVNTTGTTFVLGQLPGVGSDYWPGSVDEVRLCTAARSTNYIATDYAIQSSTTMVSVGSPANNPILYVNPAVCQRTCAITIAGTNIAETNIYAVLLTGSASSDTTKFGTRLPSEIFTLAQNGGGDICFTSDAAGQNLLPCEIVSFNTATSTAEIWVAVPLTAATTATIYAWYQSCAGTLTQPMSSTPWGSQGVWNGTYGVGNMVAVFHFGTPTTWSGADSTSNGNSLTPNGVPTATAGWIGGELNVASTNYATNASATGLPQGTAASTLQTWFALTANTSNVAIGGWGTGTAQERRDHFYTGTLLEIETDATSAGFSWTYDTNWHCLVSVNPSGGSNLSSTLFYLDGASKTNSGSGNTNLTGTNLAFGTEPGTAGTGNLPGAIDEVRLSSVARSANYLATDYAVQHSTTMVAAGTPAASSVTTISPAASNALAVTDTASAVLQPQYTNPGLCTRTCPLTIAGSSVSESNIYAVLFDGSGDSSKFGTRLPDELFTGTYAAQANGNDICFTSDAAGLHQLPMELVWYNPSGKQAEIWVSVPLTAGSSTTIYVWYHASRTISRPMLATVGYGSQGVWGNTFSYGLGYGPGIGGMIAVYHFGTPTAWSGSDSTSYANNFAANGTPSNTAGEFGGCFFVNGSFMRESTSLVGAPQGSAPRTQQTWFKLNSNASNQCLGGWGSATANERWEIIYDYGTPGSWDLDTDGAGSTASWTYNTNWNSVTAVNPAGNTNMSGALLYINGTNLPVSGSGTISTTGTTNAIGQLVGVNNYYYQGYLDEYRVCVYARSANYIATEQAIQTGTSLVTVGTPATVTVAGCHASVYSDALTGLTDAAVATIMPRYANPGRCGRTCPLTISGSAITESNTYAVLFDGSGDSSKFGTRLPDEIFTGANAALASGIDICFTSDAAGYNQLACELVWFAPATKQAEIWVAVPLIAGTNATIYVWYHGSSSTVKQPAATGFGSQGVWGTALGIGPMAAVYHFGTPTAYSGAESSGNSTAYTSSGGTPSAAAGEFGGSLYVNGSYYGTEGATINANEPLGSSQRTLQAWFKLTSSSTNQSIGGWGTASSGGRYEVIFDEPNGWQIDIDGYGTSLVTGWTYNTNWNAIAAVNPVGSTNLSTNLLYMNGVNLPITGSGVINTSNSYIGIGNLVVSNAYPWGGYIDEFRISALARSANYLASEQLIWTSTTLITVGTPTTPSTASTNVSIHSDALAVTDLATETLVRLYVAPNLCNRRCALTISGTLIAETNTYAVLFDGSGDNSKFGTRLPDEIFSLCQSNGGDVCFTSDSAGNTQLPVEVVSFNSGNKTAEIWVAVPLTAATSKTIYVWYATQTRALNQPLATATYGSKAVWNGSLGIGGSSNYLVLVSHDGGITDSTGTQTLTNNGVTKTGVGSGGQIGAAGSFAGTGYIDFGTGTVLTMDLQWTIQLWEEYTSVQDYANLIQLDWASQGTGCLWSTGKVGNTNLNGDTLRFGSPNSSYGGWVGSTSSSYAIDNNQSTWHNHVLAHTTNTGTTTTTYMWEMVDGSGVSLVGGYSGGAAATAHNYIGYNGTNGQFPGNLDEIRFTNALRSQNYCLTDYRIQSSNALITVGTPGVAPFVTQPATSTLTVTDAAVARLATHHINATSTISTLTNTAGGFGTQHKAATDTISTLVDAGLCSKLKAPTATDTLAVTDAASCYEAARFKAATDTISTLTHAATCRNTVHHPKATDTISTLASTATYHSVIKHPSVHDTITPLTDKGVGINDGHPVSASDTFSILQAAACHNSTQHASAKDTLVVRDSAVKPAPHAFATSTLVVSDTATWTKIHRVWDTVTVTDAASCYNRVKHLKAGDTISVSSKAVGSNGNKKQVSASDSLTLSDAAHKGSMVHCPKGHDTLMSLHDAAACHDSKWRPTAVDTLVLHDAATGRPTQHLAATDTLGTLADHAACYNATHHAAATDTLTFTEKTVVKETTLRLAVTDVVRVSDTARALRPAIKRAAVDTLALGESTVVHGTVHAASADVLQTSYQTFNADTNEFVTVYFGLQDTASTVNFHAGNAAKERLTLRDAAYCLNVRANAKTAVAADRLAISDTAVKSTVVAAADRLTLSDTAHANAGYPSGDMLLVGDRASANVVRLLHAQDTLIVEQSFVHLNPNDLFVKRDYHPFIGAGAAANPEPPPANLTGPDPAAPEHFALFYPATGSPTDILVLRDPEFGNKDRLQFNRICRETRGGTLIVFADPMWVKTQNLVLNFSALTQEQANALLTFMEEHLGLEIGLWDWESRQWIGVITNPNEPVVQDSKASYTGALEFEGQLV